MLHADVTVNNCDLCTVYVFTLLHVWSVYVCVWMYLGVDHLFQVELGDGDRKQMKKWC